ncbi:MAG: DUF29 family protein [Runella slithyformis]|nr:MAG: DUF29 family protein [Runella slithyformis]TAF29686.1 MAG: DUF29 family protein [Runella slithyformis]TAF48505.1 MAG: DUF29 family protein [Runella slithyformis]TAF83303.1 MAG: DUF29 family protein [Runella slithyformis]
MTTDWEELIVTSHLDTVTRIKWLLEEQEYEEAREGIVMLEETMSIAQKRSIESQLTRLMLHILKWKYQPAKRSTSWARSIVNARLEIEKWQTEKPSYNNEFILNSLWERSQKYAVIEAKVEMNLSRKDTFEPTPLTWQEVFEDEYLLEND